MNSRQTPLYDFHLVHGARMVPFAGWDMPVQYADGIKAEHLATRAAAGLFDVSHMAQVWLSGSGAGAMLERLTPTDVDAIGDGRVRYSLFLNDQGGVLDDLMIARHDGKLQLVVNAGRADHDIGLLRASLDASVTMEVRSDLALLALQGPAAPQVLRRLGADLDGFVFMQIRTLSLAGIDCVVTRSGYTGEDGFEISFTKWRSLNCVRTKYELLGGDNVFSLNPLESLHMYAYGSDWPSLKEILTTDFAGQLSLLCKSNGIYLSV